MSETAYIVFGETVCFVGGASLALLFVGAIVCLAAEVWIAARDKWFRIIKAEKLIMEFNKRRTEFESWLAEMGEDDAAD